MQIKTVLKFHLISDKMATTKTKEKKKPKAMRNASEGLGHRDQDPLLVGGNVC